MCVAYIRGGKRKLAAAAEESSDASAAEAVENSDKSEGAKAAETKRPKRQVAAVDKAKVIVPLLVVVYYAICHKAAYRNTRNNTISCAK